MTFMLFEFAADAVLFFILGWWVRGKWEKFFNKRKEKNNAS